MTRAQRTVATGRTVPTGHAMAAAEQAVAVLERLPEVERATYAGALRRMCDAVDRVEIVAASTDPGPVVSAFCAMGLIARIDRRDESSATGSTRGGLPIHLHVCRPRRWGAALLHHTGPPEHHLELQQIARHLGYRLAEDGLFDAETTNMVDARTEEHIYRRLGLAYIPPTLRSGAGEIDAALHDSVPTLVDCSNIRGDLHLHPDPALGLAPSARGHDQAIDGSDLWRGLVETARASQYRYLALVDRYVARSPTAWMTMPPDAPARPRPPPVDDSTIFVLRGLEVELGPDGSLECPSGTLDECDVVIASIRSHLDQSPAAMTSRLVRACQNPRVNIINHRTGCLGSARPHLGFDREVVCEAAASTGTALEITALGDRFGPSVEFGQHARGAGVLFSITTDASSAVELSAMRFGVARAQRSWVGPKQVINTWPIAKLRRFLAKGRPVPDARYEHPRADLSGGGEVHAGAP